jgi:hypothetical protein
MSETLLSEDELTQLIETGSPDRSDVESEILETAGVTSPVWSAPRDEEDATIVGHVLLADYDEDVSFPSDGRDLSRIERVEEEARSLDGVSALFESSPGSYHVWSLSVDDLSGRVLDALALHGDPMHTAVSWRRSMFVLRCAPKTYSESIDAGDPETYKPAPRLLDVIESESEDPQSRPHMELLRSLAEQQDRGDLVEDVGEDAHEWVGTPDSVGVSRYMTVTDDLKREVW